jgi:hypothetical protein
MRRFRRRVGGAARSPEERGSSDAVHKLAPVDCSGPDRTLPHPLFPARPIAMRTVQAPTRSDRGSMGLSVQQPPQPTPASSAALALGGDATGAVGPGPLSTRKPQLRDPPSEPGRGPRGWSSIAEEARGRHQKLSARRTGPAGEGGGTGRGPTAAQEVRQEAGAGEGRRQARGGRWEGGSGVGGWGEAMG